MKSISLTQLREVLPGRPLTVAPHTPNDILAVSTDSRMIEPHCLFVAIKGDTHDGHAHIQSAAAKGAIAVLVEHSAEDLQRLFGQSLPQNCYVYQVASTRTALGRLAAFVRRGLQAKVVAVGGSNGKTSTKHLIHSVLSSKLTGTMSPKSFNNDIGVPTTIFGAEQAHDFLVLEVGTNHHGELKPLSEMAQPDIAIITSISAEHLEGLTDLTGVRKEEASITAGLKPGGLLVVNGDDAELRPLVSTYAGKIVTFGFSPTNDLFATDIEITPAGTRFSLNASRRDVFVPQLGRHAATNALAAIAVARRMGLAEDEIIAALATAHSPDMRLQIQQGQLPDGLGEVTILNDAYNANPASVQAAVETLLALPAGTPNSPARRVAVVGDMRELGDQSDFYHLELGRKLARIERDVDLFILVGQQSKLIEQELLRGRVAASRIVHFNDSAAAAKSVPALLQAGDLVLLKASRGIALEKIAAALLPAATGRKVG